MRWLYDGFGFTKRGGVVKSGHNNDDGSSREDSVSTVCRARLCVDGNGRD